MVISTCRMCTADLLFFDEMDMNVLCLNKISVFVHYFLTPLMVSMYKFCR